MKKTVELSAEQWKSLKYWGIEIEIHNLEFRNFIFQKVLSYIDSENKESKNCILIEGPYPDIGNIVYEFVLGPGRFDIQVAVESDGIVSIAPAYNMKETDTIDQAMDLYFKYKENNQ